MMTEKEIRTAIINHIAKTGKCPNYNTIGSDYYEASPIFKAMIEDGSLVWETKVSPKGRKNRVIRLGEVK